ncbi:MAG: 50S ribosomal protein L9 [Lentisphaeria bacterium]
MATELILLEDVNNLGQMGEKVSVSEGYARNYLVPRQLATPVTPQALQRLEAKKQQLQEEHEERLAVAQGMAEKINKISITLPVEATEEDKLYGSITAQQLAEALAAEGIELEPECFLMEEPIRELGVYNIDVHLHPEVNTTLKVWVVKK